MIAYQTIIQEEYFYLTISFRLFVVGHNNLVPRVSCLCLLCQDAEKRVPGNEVAKRTDICFLDIIFEVQIPHITVHVVPVSGVFFYSRKFLMGIRILLGYDHNFRARWGIRVKCEYLHESSARDPSGCQRVKGNHIGHFQKIP